MVHLSKMRENHLEYSSELARYSNEVTTTYKETPRTDAENKSLTDLALRGLHLLSDWTCVVTELTSWKLLHPTDHHQNNDCPSEVNKAKLFQEVDFENPKVRNYCFSTKSVPD